jgi:CopG family nickel-responsive transcriptional regulator
MRGSDTKRSDTKRSDAKRFDTKRSEVKEGLVRFGVAMESSLVEQLDQMAEARGCNRSELLRDLTRAEASRAVLTEHVQAFASVTLVYNHHVRELSERLTSLQHDVGDQVCSTMHVHLDHEHCMEVIVMRGRSDELKATTDRMLGTRGVLHGGAEYVAESMLTPNASSHGHNHGKSTPHVHGAEERHSHSSEERHSHNADDPSALADPALPPRKARLSAGRGKRRSVRA